MSIVGDIPDPPLARKLVAIIELGGYPNFTSLYIKAGFAVTAVNSVRKALGAIRQSAPDLIIAEFNFQSDFRDRTSNLESLLAVTQRMPQTKVIVFYDAEHSHQFAKLRGRFTIFDALAYPIDPARLVEILHRTEAMPSVRTLPE
ncbi:MAG: hypothetical protein ACYDDO_07565 [Acidiferrobacterales bacterium]